MTDQGFYAQVGGQRLESDGTRIFESQPKNEKAGYDQKGYHAKVGVEKEDLIASVASISENKGNECFYVMTYLNTAQRQFENRVINSKLLIIFCLDNFIINARLSQISG